MMVRQRLVLCYFSLLAIINMYTMRLCLDYSFNRIAEDENVFPKSKRLRGGADFRFPSYMQLREQVPKTEWSKSVKKQIRTLRVELSPKRETLLRSKWTSEMDAEPKRKSSSNPKLTTSGTSDVWTKEVQVLVTIAFNVGYMITHIPGGRLAERYGGKWVLGASILSAGCLTILTPTIVRCAGPGALVGVRLLIGFCEGPTFPSVCTLLSQWVPENERGLLCSLVLGGGEIGITCMALVNGLSVGEQNWETAFYVVGSGAILWFMGFMFLCYSNPDDSPFIHNSERQYIKRDMLITREDEAEGADKDCPWSGMMSNGSTWALIAASVQHDWNQEQMSEELQQVFSEMQTKGESMWTEVENNLKSTAPHLCSWLGTLTTGSLSDYLVKEGILTRTQTRRLMSWLVFISVSMYLVHERDPTARVWSVIALAAYYAGIKLLPLDMAPNFAGSLMAISNGLGALPSLFRPILQQLEMKYPIVGTIRAAVWLICTAYISGDVQSYNCSTPPAPPAPPDTPAPPVEVVT